MYPEEVDSLFEITDLIEVCTSSFAPVQFMLTESQGLSRIYRSIHHYHYPPESVLGIVLP